MFLSLRIIYVEKDLNSKIKIMHERALRNAYQDKKSSFETLLKRDKSTPIHMKNSNTRLLSYLR